MKYNEDLPVRRFFHPRLPPFTSFTVDGYPSYRPPDPLIPVPHPVPRH